MIFLESCPTVKGRLPLSFGTDFDKFGLIVSAGSVDSVEGRDSSTRLPMGTGNRHL